MEKLISEYITNLSPEKSCPFYDPYHETLKTIYKEPWIRKIVFEADEVLKTKGFNYFKYNKIDGDEGEDDDFSTTEDFIGQKEDALLDQALKFKSDLSVLKGKSFFKLLDNLKELRSTLSKRELDILKKRTTGKVTLAERSGLVLRILVLEGIRQGSVLIKEVTIPMAKVLAVATIRALIGGTGGGIVGAVLGAGIGAIPGALLTGALGALPGLIMNGLPILIKGMTKFIKEVVRDDNIIKGLPIGLLTPHLLVAVAAPLIIKLLFNYIKTRVFIRIPAPKTQAGITNELMLLISGTKPTKELIDNEDNIKSRVGIVNLSSKYILNNKLRYRPINANYYTESESLIEGLKSVGTSLTVNHREKKYCTHFDLILTISNIHIECKFILPHSSKLDYNFMANNSNIKRVTQNSDKYMNIGGWYNVRIKCHHIITRKLIIDGLNNCKKLKGNITSDWKDGTVGIETGEINFDHYQFNQLLYNDGKLNKKRNPLYFAINNGVEITNPNSLLYVALLSLND